MIKSSKSWRNEAESWLAAPCTYTTAKCLSSHVQALQVATPNCAVLFLMPHLLNGSSLTKFVVCLVLQTVLDDSAQIRSTLQGFSSVLKEMSQVCDITALQEQLIEADHQVADVQDNFTAPLSQLEHAAAVSLKLLHRCCCLSVNLPHLLLLSTCVLLVLMDLLLSRRWKPSRVKSGGWRVTWLRSRPCYRLQRLCPAPEKIA